MINRINPCRDCDRRSAICHAQCVEYHEWAAALRAEKAKAWAEASGHRELAERAHDVSAKRKRKEHMNGRR